METFWAIDCTKPIREGFIFVRCIRQGDGIRILETQVSDVAPSKDIQLVGDYDLCQDWLYGNRERLEAAIEASPAAGLF